MREARAVRERAGVCSLLAVRSSSVGAVGQSARRTRLGSVCWLWSREERDRLARVSGS